LDSDGNIRKICNNYSRMSFDVGPTLMSWLKTAAPRCYEGIVSADRLGQARFSGHGPAIAQVYSHMIMPLANLRDKETQVKWGIESFKSDFGRMPEGMWLAETAVDTETLEVLAENGIKFTILAPSQAAEVRQLDGTWQDVRGGRVDTGMAYRCDLPSGRSIALFFYDGAVSHAIAFEGLLNDGGNFARRLIDAKPSAQAPTLSHVATDGESYGHHHDHGDMALAYCLETIDQGKEAELTVYGEFLEKFPPRFAARIVENSSWSCAHGVERWRSDCGCSNGTPGYNQKWRGPLRAAMDWLRDKLISQFDYEGEKLLKDRWRARDEYIAVVLDRLNGRSPDKNVPDAWLAERVAHPLSDDEKIRALKLLESQRCAMLMYTSCGWFFDEISGLESTQIMRYAARAIELIHDLTGLDFEREFLRMLEKAPSNVPAYGTGRGVYNALVKPSSVSFERIAAHYGMLAMFSDAPTEIDKGCWKMTGEKVMSSEAIVAGYVCVASTVTNEKKTFIFVSRYKGETAIACGIAPCGGDAKEKPDVSRAVDEAGGIDAFFALCGNNVFDLRHILGDAQRAMIDRMLGRDTEKIEDNLRGIVKNYNSLFSYLKTLGIQAPFVIRAAASITITAEVVRALKSDVIDISDVRQRVKRAAELGIAIDSDVVVFSVVEWMISHMRSIYESPTNDAEMERMCDAISCFTDDLHLHLSLYDAQNLYYATLTRDALMKRLNADTRASFLKLGKALRFSDEVLREAKV
jgi:alpha-amylase/alpha-mannosidase (GH57 family)